MRNLEDTISINHNWTNVFGVRHIWTHLQSELQLVRTKLFVPFWLYEIVNMCVHRYGLSSVTSEQWMSGTNNARCGW